MLTPPCLFLPAQAKTLAQMVGLSVAIHDLVVTLRMVAC